MKPKEAVAFHYGLALQGAPPRPGLSIWVCVLCRAKIVSPQTYSICYQFYEASCQWPLFMVSSCYQVNWSGL